MDAKQTKNSNGRPSLNSFFMFAGRGKLTFGKQSYIGSFHDDKMIGPGTYIFPNGTQQHGEYIVVEEELEEPLETFKGKDGDTEHRSRTKQVKIKWISRNGDVPPVTIVKKETIINWPVPSALETLLFSRDDGYVKASFSTSLSLLFIYLFIYLFYQKYLNSAFFYHYLWSFSKTTIIIIIETFYLNESSSTRKNKCITAISNNSHAHKLLGRCYILKS